MAASSPFALHCLPTSLFKVHYPATAHCATQCTFATLLQHTLCYSARCATVHCIEYFCRPSQHTALHNLLCCSEVVVLHWEESSSCSITSIPGIIGWKQRHSPLHPRLLPPHTNITQVTNPSVQRLYFLMICCIFSDNHRKSRKQIQQLLSDDL